MARDPKIVRAIRKSGLSIYDPLDKRPELFVVTAKLERIGTLTHRYQAKSRMPVTRSKLVSPNDTRNVRSKQLSARSPVWKDFVPIQQLFERLGELRGKLLSNPGIDQERARAWLLHDALRHQLGEPSWSNHGQFPDVTDQLLEIKLQTRPTIDLGLVATGERFFSFFRRFEGKVRNAKLQIPLPLDFFD